MESWNGNQQYPMIPWIVQMPPPFIPPPAPSRLLYSLEEITPLIKVIVREIYEAEAATTLQFMNDDDDDEDEDIDQNVTLEELRNNTTIHVVDSTKEDSICAICHEELSKGSIVRKLRCNHDFHMYCIDRVLENSITCPMCRASVISNDDNDD